MMDCSSEKVVWSSFAMYVASVDDDEDGEGTALGGYVTSRTAAWGLRDAELVSPGVSWIVSAT